MLDRGLRLRPEVSACHFLATVRGFLRLVNFPKCCYVSVLSLVTLRNVYVVRGSCQVTRVICTCNNTPCLWITHNDLPRSDRRMYFPCLIVSFMWAITLRCCSHSFSSSVMRSCAACRACAASATALNSSWSLIWHLACLIVSGFRRCIAVRHLHT